MLVSKKLCFHLHESPDIWPIISLSLDLTGGVVTKSRNIIYLVKSQPLFDVHRQYLWTFPMDLQAEVSRFHCLIFHCLAHFLKT